jgi:hypothetical protein
VIVDDEEEDVTDGDIDTVAQLSGHSSAGMRCPGCGREFTISGGHHLIVFDTEYSEAMDLP